MTRSVIIVEFDKNISKFCYRSIYIIFQSHADINRCGDLSLHAIQTQVLHCKKQRVKTRTEGGGGGVRSNSREC